MNQNLLLAITR